MDIMKNLTVCLSKRFRLYKTSIISNFPSSFGNCHSRSVFFFFLKNKQTNKKPQACNGLKKKKSPLLISRVSYLPQSFSWAGLLSTFQLQFSCCCWRINWFERESLSSVRFSSDLFLDLNIYAGSSMKRPWVLSPTALMCLQRPLALSQIIGRRISISLSERGREGSVRAYWGWEWNICDLFSSRWMVWIRSDMAAGWACGLNLKKAVAPWLGFHCLWHPHT